MPNLSMQNRDRAARLRRLARCALGLPTVVLALAAAWVPSPVAAQAELVADINQGNGPVADGYPDGFANLDGDTYFTACSQQFGCELWRSDQGSAGAVPVADTCPGPCDSNPRDLTATVHGLLFTADDGQHGRELWLLRPGSGQPPQMLPEFLTGPGDSDPRHLIVLSPGSVAAVAWTWLEAGDGTHAPAQLVDIGGDPTWSVPVARFNSFGPFVEQGGRLFVSAGRADQSEGDELWRIDNPTGPFNFTRVREIRPGSEGSSIRDMVAVPQRGGVFFRADDGSSGPEPWFSDGTAAGTRRLADIAPGSAGSRPSEPVAFANGSVFFFADDVGTGGNRDLWTVEGAGLTARKVRNFGNGLAQGLRPLGGGMVFTASDGGSGEEFWASGGLPQNTFLIVDLIPGSAGLDPYEATVADGFYYLTGGEQLYRTNGTAAGTRRVGTNTGVFPIRTPHAAVGRVLFANGEGAGEELYHSRVATPDEINLIANIAEDLGHSQGAGAWVGRSGVFELSGGTVLFAFDEDEGLELRRLDGAGGASVLVPTQAGPGSLLDEFRLQQRTTQVRDGRLYFVDQARTLWVSDGTPAGTRQMEQLGDPPIAAQSVDCVLPRSDGDVLVLFGPGGSPTLELWRIDGDGGPSQPLLTAALLPAGASLGTQADTCPVELGSQLLLPGVLPATGLELFRSNLSPGHLVLVRDLAPGSASGLGSRVEPVRVGGKLYFVGDSSGTGTDQAPWVSDGTAQGTFRLGNIGFNGGSTPHSFTAYGDAVVFAADTSPWGHQLWRSDGTVAGTQALTDPFGQPVKVVLPLAEDGPAGQAIAVVGSRMFFAATGIDSGSGSRLYVSQGQLNDVRMVEPVAATGPLAPQQLRVVPGAGVVFAGYQGASGRELWFSDGSAAGTLLAADVRPGPGHGGPHGISVLSDGVYFSADDGLSGREPWRLSLPRAETIFSNGFQ